MDAFRHTPYYEVGVPDAFLFMVYEEISLQKERAITLMVTNALPDEQDYNVSSKHRAWDELKTTAQERALTEFHHVFKMKQDPEFMGCSEFLKVFGQYVPELVKDKVFSSRYDSEVNPFKWVTQITTVE